MPSSWSCAGGRAKLEKEKEEEDEKKDEDDERCVCVRYLDSIAKARALSVN